MGNKSIPEGTVHTIPDDLRSALYSDPNALKIWGGLTPLARNEWICWVTYVKQDKTRRDHVKRTVKEIKEGKRRPCCWIGCIHRTNKRISSSVQHVPSKRRRNSSE